MALTEDHIEHMTRISERFSELMGEKYMKGVEEHGGNLWNKDGLLDMAIEEAIDMVVYLLTLKEQNEERKRI